MQVSAEPVKKNNFPFALAFGKYLKRRNSLPLIVLAPYKRLIPDYSLVGNAENGLECRSQKVGFIITDKFIIIMCYILFYAVYYQYYQDLK